MRGFGFGRRIKKSALRKFEAAKAAGDVKIVSNDPEARAVGAALLQTVSASRAGADAPSGKIYEPGGSVRESDWASVLELVFTPMRVPIWSYDPTEVEGRTIPSDLQAELNLFALLHMYAHAATMNPLPPVTGSTTSTGTNVTLAHPTAADPRPMIVPAFLLELAPDESTSQLGQVAGTITGWLYGGGTPDLEANAATTADHYTATSADWSTGTFSFVPRVRRKTTIVIHPYKSVNSKTYLCPAQLANIDTMAATALTATLDTTAQPSGMLVEFTAVGVDHDYFRSSFSRLANMLD